MKKFILIPIVAALTACSGMQTVENVKTMDSLVGIKNVSKRVLKVTSGGRKSSPMPAVAVSQLMHKPPKSRCMPLQ